nr:kinase-like domain,concanavalin A-like lectin/glucanase domain protein [Tanacetum cinerariifolium]
MESTITEFTHLQIPLEDVLKATNNFADENIIGKGGFGNVYKGKLIHSGELRDISARRLDREKIIIHNHYAKGSLLMYLSDPTFSWYRRLNISVAVADAISYLHLKEGQSYSVIHRNINSFTILLDGNFTPMLSGFEFSIKHSVDRKNQALLTEAVGTRGYMDPAIGKTGGVTHKSDVYSFGVVLFELLCGRKAFDPNEDNNLLTPLVKFHYENKTLQNIIHPDLYNQIGQETIDEFSKIAYSCLENDRVQRPDMIKNSSELHSIRNESFEYSVSSIKRKGVHIQMKRQMKDSFLAKFQNVKLEDSIGSTSNTRKRISYYMYT